jgi:hypothetical protein
VGSPLKAKRSWRLRKTNRKIAFASEVSFRLRPAFNRAKRSPSPYVVLSTAPVLSSSMTVQMEDDVGDRPALTPGRPLPVGFFQPSQEAGELGVLLSQGGDDGVHDERLYACP